MTRGARRAIGAAIAGAVAVAVWLIMRPRPLVKDGGLLDEDGNLVVYMGADAQADAWAKALAVDRLWMRSNLDRVEDEAYAMADAAGSNIAGWASWGWPTPVGPRGDLRRWQGPTLAGAPAARV